jgi:hypothetical protein
VTWTRHAAVPVLRRHTAGSQPGPDAHPAPGGQGGEQAAGERKLSPIPAGLTLHGLRHTYVSIESTTLPIYTKVMRTGQDERDRLRALVEGEELAPTGTEDADGEPEDAAETADGTPETRTTEPDSETRPGRFERPTSRSGGGTTKALGPP